jgi:hypothetical protein
VDDADGGVLERATEPLLALAQRLLGDRELVFIHQNLIDQMRLPALVSPDGARASDALPAPSVMRLESLGVGMNLLTMPAKQDARRGSRFRARLAAHTLGGPD